MFGNTQLEKENERLRTKVESLETQLHDIERSHKDTLRIQQIEAEDQRHATKRAHDKEVRDLTEKLQDLRDRTSTHEDELTTLKEEKRQAEEAAAEARKELRTALDNLAEVTQKTQMQQEMLAHNAKILQEKNELDCKKKELKFKEEYQEKEAELLRDSLEEITKVKEECHERIQTEHAKRSEEFQNALRDVIDRLPKVNVNAMMGNQPLADQKDD